MSDTRPSRLSATIDLNRNGKHVGFVRLPHSVHRSAYGWLPIPIVSIRNGDGPKVLLNAGNHGDEWKGRSRSASSSASCAPRTSAAR